MRTISLFVLSLLATAAMPAWAESVEGVVERQASRWDQDGSTIITASLIREPGGALREVVQIGGSVDGIGMHFSHQPPVLKVGQAVVLRAEVARSISGAESWVVQSVQTQAISTRLYAITTPANYGVERTRESGRALHYQAGCVHYVYDAKGTTHLGNDTEFEVLDAAFDTWAGAAEECGMLAFTRELAELGAVGRDGLSTVTFREESWCRPATATEPRICYDPAAGAVTRLIFVDDASDPLDGTILEADIDINAVDFALADRGASLSEKGELVDLQSVLTHEVGHALGLTHNCWNGAGQQALDHFGRLVPHCDELPLGSPALQATMYYQVQPGKTDQQTLEDGDRAAVCAISHGQDCAMNYTGGCSAAGVSTSNFALLSLLALFVAMSCGRQRRLRVGAYR